MMTEPINGFRRAEDPAVLVLRGDDAGEFLNGQVSNDVAALADGESRYALLLTPKGKLRADMRIAKDGDETLVVTSAAHLPAIRHTIDTFRIGYFFSTEDALRFVRALPAGYDTVIDEESSNLSAGQKQLITIARAFVARPSLLILDEATSAVDTRTELLVQRAMAALRANRTSFVIAHRLSTIRDADLILVMEHGRIVEQGTHAELLGRHGAYERLYRAQFSRAEDEAAV